MINGTQITIVGNVGNDPEMRYTPTGQAVSSFSVGVQNRRTRDGDEWKDNGTTWYRVTAWRDLAENIAQSITRGTRVIVVGILASREWKDKEDNQRVTWEITADACGPDLQYANVAVARSRRTRPGNGSEPGNTAEPVSAKPDGADDSGEPPF